MPLLTLGLAAAMAAPPCPEATSPEDFLHGVQRGEQAFAQMDLPGLHTARDEALGDLVCLGGKISPQVAAAFHRLMALEAFTAGDRALVLAEFHAARRLEPGYAIPHDVAPVGHPLVHLYEQAADAAEGALEPPIPPLNGYVMVDGIRGAPRPSGISTVLQIYEDDELVETLLLGAGERMPTWGPMPLEELQRKRFRLGLYGGAGVAAVAATGLFIGHRVAYSRFWSDDADALPSEELGQLRTTSNALLASSAGVGVAALGLGLVAVWRF